MTEAYLILSLFLGIALGIAATSFYFKKSIQTQEEIHKLEKNTLLNRIELHDNELDKVQEQFRDQFENLANKIFESHSNKMKSDSEKNIKQLVNPLKERLSEFQKKVEETYHSEARERFALKKEIDKIVDANEKITLEAHNLTQALKGDSKTQGNWGEMVLEKILESSGLRSGEEYVLQGKDLKLKNEDGVHLKPDVIINLPENKHVIIDSKVSLTNYERYMNGDSEAQKTIELKSFAKSLYAHIDGLAAKKYHHLEKLITPDFVLMFVPLEGALALAQESDQRVFSYAWDKSIIIVSPSTLLATLRTVASIWKQERQSQNALEIARQGGQLYDKFVGFLSDMEDIRQSIKKSEKVFDGAMTKLHGRGGLISRSEKLKELGAKSDKQIPETYLSTHGELSFLEEPQKKEG